MIANRNITSTPQKRTRHLHFVSRRMRSVFDLAITITTLGVLVGTAAGTYHIYLMRAHVGEALMMAASIKERLTENFYLTGEWSSRDPGIFDLSGNDRTIKRIDYEKGGVTFAIERGDANYLLSFRAALPDASPRSPTLWLCGYAEAPDAYHTIAVNRTNLPLAYLTAECRG